MTAKKKQELAVSTEVKKIDLAENFLPSQDELNVMTAIVKAVTAGQRNPAGAGTALNLALTARELGLPIMGAVNGLLYTVGGKVGMAALTMRHLIKQQGHIFTIKEEEDTHAVVYGKRRDTGEEMTIKYTMEQAEKAGLVKEGGNYEKVPSDMMLARATGKLARRLFEDVIASCPYVGEELQDLKNANPDGDPTVTDAEVITPEDDKLAEEISKAAETENQESEKDLKAKESAASKKNAKEKKKDELTPAEKRAATRAKKLAEKEAAEKKAQADKEEAERQEKLEAEARLKEEASKAQELEADGEVVDAEFTVKEDKEEATPRQELDVKVGINSETDDRFDDIITTEETDAALAFAAKANEEKVEDMVARIMNEGVFDSFWTWLANFVIEKRVIEKRGGK